MKKPLAIFRTKKKTMDEQNSKETQTPRNTNHPENKTKKITLENWCFVVRLDP